MKTIKTKKKKKIFVLTILLSVLVISTIVSMNYTGIAPNEKISEENDLQNDITNNIQNEIQDETNSNESPEISILSYESWWNGSWNHRKLINITNPYNENFTNFVTSLTFNYTELGADIQDDLDDIRIIKDEQVQDYYYKKDYNNSMPQEDIVTVYFKTNITANSMTSDTFLYYGNTTNPVGKDSGHYTKMGLEHRWDFEEGGGKAYDSISTNNGTTGGDVAWDSSDSVIGEYSATFDGTGDYFALEKSYSEFDSITISCWIRTTDTEGYMMSYDRSELFRYAVGSDGAATGEFSWHTGKWEGSPTPTTRYINDMASGIVVNDNAWHHVVAMYNHSTGEKITYVDGTNRYEVSWRTGGLGPVTEDGDTLRYGFIGVGSEATTFDGSKSPADWYLGNIDDLRIYTKELTDGEVKWLYNNYELQTVLNEKQNKAANIKILVRDVEGRMVSNVLIKLIQWDYQTGAVSVNYSDTTSESTGSVTFGSVRQDAYNITAEYQIPGMPLTTVLNTTQTNFGPDKKYNFTGLYYTIDVTVNLTTFDIEIVDNEGTPFPYAYANISYGEDPGGTIIQSINLENSGKGTFTWLNRSGGYYYQVYFNNTDYADNNFLLNRGPIDRAKYLAVKERSQTYRINVTNNPDLFGQQEYDSIETIFTNGTLIDFSNKKVINATITIKEDESTPNNITSITIHYVDEDGDVSVANKIYEETFSEISTWTKNFDIYELDKDNLETDDYEVHGLWIRIKGNNNTICKGIVEVNFTETWNIYNSSAVSKMSIQVIDNTEFKPLGGVIIHINQTNPQEFTPSSTLVNLTTVYNADSLDREAGFAYGADNPMAEFWYKVNYNYTFTLQYLGRNVRPFLVNETVPSIWKPAGIVTSYEYTLTQNSNITLNLEVNLDQYYTNFSFSKTENTDCTWGEEIYFEVNFSATTDDGAHWNPILDSSDVKCSIYLPTTQTLLIQETMLHQDDGNYTISINSNRLAAAFSSRTYLAKITAVAGLYTAPIPLSYSLTITAKSTSISLHNYPSLTVKTSNNITEYYDELVNVTVKYYEVGQTAGLGNANLTYSWQYGSGQMTADPLNAGYFYYQLDTSTVGNIGSYLFYVKGQYKNYTETSISVGIEVLTRPTNINGTTKSLHNSTSIWVGNGFIVKYEYKDARSGARIGDADDAYYYWSELDEDGEPIELSKDINLKKKSGNRYELDFNASGREVGEYALYVVFEKDNYEARSAIINLKIKRRIFSASLSLNNGTGTTVSVVKGQPVVISLTLTDLTRGAASSSYIATQATKPLSGATVTLYITELSRSFTLTEEGSTGVYELTIDTSDPDYQAFFIPQTLTGNFTIEKKNYETQTLPFTLVVGMEEIFPGFPIFYFILLVVGISTVVGSLVAYRYLQIARIPKFIKDVRKMKKTIQSGETIPESLLYPSKKEMMAGMVGDKWREIGLSMEQILGIESKKGKSLPDIKNENIEGGAA